MTSGEWQLSIGAQSPSTQVDPAAAVAGVPAGKPQWANKTVLLVDSNRHSRESRAKIMRGMGVRVECAPTADAARALLDAGTYNLVLVDLGTDIAGAESLARGIRSANTRQLVGFLVGSPLFVATSLTGKRRPHRAPSLATIAPAPVPPQTSASDDFGQRIRDAEAEQAL